MTAPSSGSTVPHEVELKYRVTDLAALRAWLEDGWGEALPWATLGSPRSRAVEDRYFDTAREALRHHGFGARLRRVGGRHLVTVKSLSPDELDPDDGPGNEPESTREEGSDAVHRRIELEAPASARLDPGTWPSSPARELIDELRGAARLRGLFTIRQIREVRDVTTADASAQLSLDEVRVIAGRSVVGTFAELEVESTGGSLELLSGVARALAATGVVVPAAGSKEAQVRALVDRERAEERRRRLPRVPRTPGVVGDDTLAEAGRKVLRMHLARMLAAEEGTRLGADIEELHKMRVATRRMRSVWRVFDGAYRPKVQRRYVRELRTVASALGAVRDLDVQLEALEAWEATPEAQRAAQEAGATTAAMALRSWAAVYGHPLGGLVKPGAVKAVTAVSAGCVDLVSDGLKILREERRMPHAFLEADPTRTRPWSVTIIANTPTRAPKAPVFIGQGTADTIVAPAVTDQFVNQLCRQGARVDFVRYKGATHFDIARKAAAQAMAWIADRFAGKPAPDTCPG